MIEKIIDISAEPLKISASNNLFTLKNDKDKIFTVPLNEIACVIMAHPALFITNHVLSELMRNNVPVIVCGSSYMPEGMMIPYTGNFNQCERFDAQINAGAALKKRLWQEIIISKIKMQGELLKKIYGSDSGLLQIAKDVLSGDSSNREAWAAKIYFEAMKKDFNSGRNREAEDQNRYLNYGYMVLRAIVSRAICGAGLHPTIGLNHHNRYNQFCLADDLMEPLRPLIDEIVIEIVRDFGSDAPLEKEIKSRLLSIYTKRLFFHKSYRSIFEVCEKIANSLMLIFVGKEKSLMLPDSIILKGESNEEEST